MYIYHILVKFEEEGWQYRQTFYHFLLLYIPSYFAIALPLLLQYVYSAWPSVTNPVTQV